MTTWLTIYTFTIVTITVLLQMHRLRSMAARRRAAVVTSEPVKVHGMPKGEFRPDQVQDDDPYMRAMVAAVMNSDSWSSPMIGEVDENGDLLITKS